MQCPTRMTFKSGSYIEAQASTHDWDNLSIYTRHLYLIQDKFDIIRRIIDQHEAKSTIGLGIHVYHEGPLISAYNFKEFNTTDIINHSLVVQGISCGSSTERNLILTYYTKIIESQLLKIQSKAKSIHEQERKDQETKPSILK